MATNDNWDAVNQKPGQDNKTDSEQDKIALRVYNEKAAAEQQARDLALRNSITGRTGNSGIDTTAAVAAAQAALGTNNSSPKIPLGTIGSLKNDASAILQGFGGKPTTVDDIAKGKFAGLPKDVQAQIIDVGQKIYGKNWNMIQGPDNVLSSALLLAQNKGVSLSEGIQGLLKYKDSGSGPSGSGSGGPFTQVNKNVQLTNAGTARRLINSTLANYLGRQASEQEIAQFKQALNAEERKHPTTTVTHGYSSGSSSTSTTKTKGGYDSTDFAERYALAQEGSAEYQAATTYMDMLMKAVEDPTRLI